MEKSNLQILTNGIIKENPVLVLVLEPVRPWLLPPWQRMQSVWVWQQPSYCLAQTLIISLLKKVIPDKVRIPCYIVVIAGFVTLLSALPPGVCSGCLQRTGYLPAADRCKLYHSWPC